MIRAARSWDRPLDDLLARRIVEAIDAGLYRVHPKGPPTMGKDGTIGCGPLSAWTDRDLDLVHAAGTLRWHAVPRGSGGPTPDGDDPSVPDDDRAAATTIFRRDPRALPDIVLGEDLHDWIDHDDVAPDGSVPGRILACEPVHLAIARAAIAAPSATWDETDRAELLMGAVAATLATPEERAATIRVLAPSAWDDARFETMDDDSILSPFASRPDGDVLAILPDCVAVDAPSSPNGAGIESVGIGAFDAWFDPEDLPGPVETIRILAEARSSTRDAAP